MAEFAAYATELEESVIRGSSIKPINTGSSQSYSPFDSFYGNNASDTPSENSETVADKNPEDLNNEALRAWNTGMKERGDAVLAIPDGAALHPYRVIVNAFLWIGGGLLAVGLIPIIVSLWMGRKRRVA